VSLHSSAPPPSSRYLVRPVASGSASSGIVPVEITASDNSFASWPAAAASTVGSTERRTAGVQPAFPCSSCLGQPVGSARTFAVASAQDI